MKSLPVQCQCLAANYLYVNDSLSSTVIVPSKSVKKISFGLVAMYCSWTEPMMTKPEDFTVQFVD